MSRSPPVINNMSDHVEIANAFRTHFSDIYVESSHDQHAVNEFTNLSQCLPPSTNSSNTIEVCEIENAISHLGLNKAPDPEGIMAEHIINSHPSIVIHLKNLFMIMLSHSFVPEKFTSGIITPIIKDKRGDLSSLTNYRPITISSIVSTIFEYYLLDKYFPLLSSDMLQFGYKPLTGCPNAVFLLRRVILLSLSLEC